MVYSKEQAARDRRNINPTAEAVIAMNLWSHEYAFEQRGGSMDFWDRLDESRKRRCQELAQRIREADKAHGVRVMECVRDAD